MKAVKRKVESDAPPPPMHGMAWWGREHLHRPARAHRLADAAHLAWSMLTTAPLLLGLAAVSGAVAILDLARRRRGER